MIQKTEPTKEESDELKFERDDTIEAIEEVDLLLDQLKPGTQIMQNMLSESRETLKGRLQAINELLKVEMYSDWSLPTVKELQTLVDFSKANPASGFGSIRPGQHKTITERYSGTLEPSSSAWCVDFGNGSTVGCSKSWGCYVICVRDGEDGLEWTTSSTKTHTWDEAIEYASNLIAPVHYKATK